jgi:hypothetical protein
MTNNNKHFNYDDFMHDANSAYLLHPEGLRYGQFLMNYLAQHYPDIVVPDEVDCFYDDTKVPKFIRFILSQSESQ